MLVANTLTLATSVFQVLSDGQNDRVRTMSDPILRSLSNHTPLRGYIRLHAVAIHHQL